MRNGRHGVIALGILSALLALPAGVVTGLMIGRVLNWIAG